VIFIEEMENEKNTIACKVATCHKLDSIPTSTVAPYNLTFITNK